MAVGDAHVFPGFLTPVLTQLSFQSHRLHFSHASAEVKRRKYAGKKVRLKRVSNSEPPVHEERRRNKISMLEHRFSSITLPWKWDLQTDRSGFESARLVPDLVSPDSPETLLGILQM